MISRFTLAIGVTAGVLLAAVRPYSASFQQAAPTFRAGIDVIALDVSVLDKNRRPVKGLTPADFTILDAGEQRPVVSFEAIDLPEPTPPAAAWMREVAPDVATNSPSEGRLIVIMFDHTIAQGGPADAARRTGNAIIDRLGPSDQAAVIFTQSLQRPQNFTSDRALLRAAVASRGIGVSLMRNSTEDSQCKCGMCSLDAIRNVADVLGEVKQRQKVLFFIGSAISVDITPSENMKDDCSVYAQPATRELFAAAQRANLVVHAMDPSGVTPPPGFAGTSRGPLAQPMGGQATVERRSSLQILAERTGGRAVFSDNKPALEVPTIFGETSSYYLIGFQASGRAPARDFQKLEVRVNRPGVQVRTRSGYYGAFTEASLKSQVETRSPIERALRGTLARVNLPLRASIAPFASTTKGQTTLAIVLGFGPGAPDGLNVVTGVYDSVGREIGTRRHRLDRPVAARSGPTGDLELVSRIDLRPGRYEIRMAASDDASVRVGSVYTYVDVPDFSSSALSMSGIVIETTPAPPAITADTLAPAVPGVPTTRREFARGTQVHAFVRVYQGGSGGLKPAAIHSRIVGETNQREFQADVPLARDRFLASRAAEHTVNIPVAELAPGRYLLTIEATIGKARVSRDVRFSVIR